MSLAYIDKYVVNYIKENPNVTFHIILPLYYRYYYATWAQVDTYKYLLHKQALRHIVNATKKLNNLHIYGFENLEYADNIINYKDIKHHNSDFNSFVLKSIAQKKHMLTPENVEAYLAHCEELALAFDIVAFHDEVQRLIKLHAAEKK